jgi:hypothetical protein
MTGDQLWINHEWLAEGIMALIYSLFGARGLIGFKVLLALAISALAYRYLRGQGLAPLRACGGAACANGRRLGHGSSSYILLMVASFTPVRAHTG